MDEPVERLESREALDALFASSAQRPVLVFKHSETCGTSAQALEELRGYGRALWHASHYGVRTASIAAAVSRLASR